MTWTRISQNDKTGIIQHDFHRNLPKRLKQKSWKYRNQRGKKEVKKQSTRTAKNTKVLIILNKNMADHCWQAGRFSWVEAQQPTHRIPEIKTKGMLISSLNTSEHLLALASGRRSFFYLQAAPARCVTQVALSLGIITHLINCSG